MMYYAVYFICFFAIFFPFYSLYKIAFNKKVNLCHRISSVVIYISFSLLFLTLGFSHIFGQVLQYVLFVFFILLFPSILRFVYQSKGKPLFPKKTFKAWTKFILSMGEVVIVFIIFLSIYFARQYSDKALALQFPLKGGIYVAVNAGNSIILNPHFPRFVIKYALDISKLNKWHARASGLYPKKLEKYEIFKEPLFAPCSGEVLSIKNDAHDNLPSKRDKQNIAGNYIAIFCNGHSVLMAHLRKGSIPLSVGDRVTVGDLVGQVGNSGNTTEPHLHIHAVEGRVSNLKDLIFTAKGVPLTFNSRFLIRNDKISVI